MDLEEKSRVLETVAHGVLDIARRPSGTRAGSRRSYLFVFDGSKKPRVGPRDGFATRAKVHPQTPQLGSPAENIVKSYELLRGWGV
jgi:hypothetical protein